MGRERGSAVVEFVMVLPAVILILLAIAEVVVVARAQLDVAHAAREGARVAATTPDTTRAVVAVHELLDPAVRTHARVSVVRPAEVGAVAWVEVKVPYRLPIVGVRVWLRSRSVMRVEL